MPCTGYRQLPTRRPKAHLIRVSIVMVSNVAYFLGLAAMPLADAVAVGMLGVAQAYRLNEAGLVAPFEYFGMPMAIFWGVVVFGRWPDVTAWAGIALICGAGLYTLMRETLHRKESPDET